MDSASKLLIFAASLVLLSAFSSALSAQQVQAIAQNYSGNYNVALPSMVTSIIGSNAVLQGVVDGQTVGYAVVSGGALTQITTSPMTSTLQVGLSSDTLNAIVSSSNPQNAAIRAFANGQISISGLGPAAYIQMLTTQIGAWIGTLFGQFN